MMAWRGTDGHVGSKADDAAMHDGADVVVYGHGCICDVGKKSMHACVVCVTVPELGRFSVY